ncbi:MAG: molecular chaperone HtpG [Leptolinea sp.]|jgi:molecular chaperone HtpG|nr:molecular chaperone HtpG [Leptolinea sp.]
MNNANSNSSSIPFRAETRQLLNILIHSLYTDREIFLRELISNASDALTRMNFEMLTNRDVLDPETELGIWITADPKKRTLTIRDTGIGLTRVEMEENLGTIAHSGARAFMQAAEKQEDTDLSNIIGQFGVGFYSVFMVAKRVEVASHSFLKDEPPAVWISDGQESFSIEESDKADRGTTITVYLKEDAAEFTDENRLRQLIQRHNDYVAFPIYVGTSTEQVNRQTALWRQNTPQISPADANEFYKQFTLDQKEPLAYTHLAVDAPVQAYALLYIPASAEHYIFAPRKQDGLRLYARKILIQDYFRDLLPEYLRFVQGVVDSEDIPLNISRETIQSNRMQIQLKKLITAKTIDMIRKLSQDSPEKYLEFWNLFGRYLKEGVASDLADYDNLVPLLRFHTLHHVEDLVSLDTYLDERRPGQQKIYYLLGDEEHSVIHSPHLDLVRQRNLDVLLLTDPMDSFMLLALKQYKDIPLVNVADKDADLGEATGPVDSETPPMSDESMSALITRFRDQLGSRIADVRASDRLIESPARLVNPENSPTQEVQRVYQMINQPLEIPRKVLEINPRHALLSKLAALPIDSPLAPLVIEQIYENALLIEGLHPDPAEMIGRIQQIMAAALDH